MKTLIGLILVFLFNTAAAQIYTWTDENGKKHYSDSPPPEYQERAKPLQMKKLNAMPKQDTSGLKFEQDTANTAKSEDEKETKEDEKSTTRQERMELTAREIGVSRQCLEDVAEYERSVACFNSCRNIDGGINRAKCPDCVNVSRPSCYNRVKQALK